MPDRFEPRDDLAAERRAQSPRYDRQVRFPLIGEVGQRRLARATVGLVGLGALGASSAALLARAGVGRLRAIDRDVVEPSNLGRQALYDADDAEAARPKAEALRRHLARIDPDLFVEAKVTHLDHTNVASLLADVDVIVDGTDNAETRYLLNDFSLDRHIPWIYGACVADHGLTATMVPGQTACLRCHFEDPPEPGRLETCDSAGILAPTAAAIAAFQVAEVIKLLVSGASAARRGLLKIELWTGRVLTVGSANGGPSPQCPACAKGDRPFSSGARSSRAVALCGRGAVQILPPVGRGPLDASALAARASASATVRSTPFQVEIRTEGLVLHVFLDGRALVLGTSDPLRARTLYDRIIGS